MHHQSPLNMITLLRRLRPFVKAAIAAVLVSAGSLWILRPFGFGLTILDPLTDLPPLSFYISRTVLYASFALPFALATSAYLPPLVTSLRSHLAAESMSSSDLRTSQTTLSLWSQIAIGFPLVFFPAFFCYPFVMLLVVPITAIAALVATIHAIRTKSYWPNLMVLPWIALLAAFSATYMIQFWYVYGD